MFVLVRENDLWITEHAAEKMVVEGISVQQICRALERGSKFRQTEGYLCVYGYFSVVYKFIGKHYKIKTVFVNKEQ